MFLGEKKGGALKVGGTQEKKDRQTHHARDRKGRGLNGWERFSSNSLGNFCFVFFFVIFHASMSLNAPGKKYLL